MVVSWLGVHHLRLCFVCSEYGLKGDKQCSIHTLLPSGSPPTPRQLEMEDCPRGLSSITGPAGQSTISDWEGLTGKSRKTCTPSSSPPTPICWHFSDILHHPVLGSTLQLFYSRQDWRSVYLIFANGFPSFFLLLLHSSCVVFSLL